MIRISGEPDILNFNNFRKDDRQMKTASKVNIMPGGDPISATESPSKANGDHFGMNGRRGLQQT